MKYKVRFEYCFEVEVEADDKTEAYRRAVRLCPDKWDEQDRFCTEIKYLGWEAEEVEETDWYKIHLSIYGAYCSTFNMTDDMDGLRSFGDFMTDIYPDTEYMIRLLTEGAKAMDVNWSELLGLYLMDPTIKGVDE